eukprot:TRINITY_DN890_c0_g2_i1.p1 TRINITY_DN890_c0_g2~~TRINITY_DN890_c0_g2_i1.p1  ORF type:complete len:515 (+),score=167.83 TRINITY_DN890_c0_g2_i1:126-1670(+)
MFSSSLSESFDGFSQQIMKFAGYYYNSYAICEAYEVAFQPYSTSNLTTSFQNGVSTLPTVFNITDSQGMESFEKFIGFYGTHIISQLIMGGLSSQQTSILTTFHSLLQSVDIDVSEQASVSFIVSCGESVNVNNNQTAYKAFETFSEIGTLEVSGGNSSYANDFITWSGTVADNPVPLKSYINPLNDILTSDYFPNDPNIADKKTALGKAIQYYIEKNGKMPALTPTLNTCNTNGKNELLDGCKVQCPDNYIALSGGCSGQLEMIDHPWKIVNSIPISDISTGQVVGWQCNMGQDNPGSESGNILDYVVVTAHAMCVPSNITSDFTGETITVDNKITRCSNSTGQYSNYCQTEECPSGYVLTGVGAQTVLVQGDNYPWALTAIRPVLGTQTVQANAGQDKGDPSNLQYQPTTGYGICSRWTSSYSYKNQLPVNYEIATCSSTIDKKYSNTCTAVCKEGYFAVGGGCASDESSTWMWRLSSSVTRDNGHTCISSEDMGSDMYNYQTYGFAFCVAM